MIQTWIIFCFKCFNIKLGVVLQILKISLWSIKNSGLSFDSPIVLIVRQVTGCFQS